MKLDKEKNSYSGLSGDKKRFVAFNGGIGEEQMKWLASELDKAKEQNQKVYSHSLSFLFSPSPFLSPSPLILQQVFICSHVPLVATSAFSPTFLWNYKEVLALIDQYPKNVVCTLAGHEHEGTTLLFLPLFSLLPLLLPFSFTPCLSSSSLLTFFWKVDIYYETKFIIILSLPLSSAYLVKMLLQ